MRTHIFLIFIIFSSGCINANKEPSELAVVLSFDYEGFQHEQDVDLYPVFEILDRHNATATFFVMGKRAETNPEDVREIYRRNYSLGLHTYYHNYPIFNKDDAALIGEIYGKSSEFEWNRSFQTEDAFYNDIIRNREAVMEATGNATTPTMFRCPSLTINWTRDPAYFEVLRSAGIEIDSSFYQDFDDPHSFYTVSGIVEVPVVASETRLDDMPKALELAGDCAGSGVPMVLYIHPQNMDESRIEALDKYLCELEERYEVTYLKIEDVPHHRTS